MPSVSAEIVVRNETLFLEASLLSIRDVFDEIIIVDHGSVDETVDIIEGQRTKIPQIRLIRADRTHSMAHCRNLAHARATSDWIFKWDSDFVAFEEADREEQSLRAFVRSFDQATPANANLIVLHAPNCGPTLSTTIRGHERAGKSSDIKLMRRGTGHYETGKYADTFVADEPLRIHHLNRDDSPFYFVHLDRLKLPERLVLRDWMFNHDRDFFSGKTALGFEDWLRASGKNLEKAIQSLLDRLSELVVPYDVKRWGPLPARIRHREADIPFRVEAQAGGAMKVLLSDAYSRNSRLRRYLDDALNAAAMA